MPNENTRTCPTCATVIPARFPEGLCPKCLLAASTPEQVTPPNESATDDDEDAFADWTQPASSLPVAGAHRPSGAPSLEVLRELFPDLDILELLGAGGMGAVYKARQPRLNRLVALKVMVCPPGHEADFALRFEREAQVLARLNHPHIVTLYDFGDLGSERTGADPLFYFLMEFVDGTDLGQLIKSRELHPPQALAIVPQICDALQYAHDQGITHRDIKPANILIDKRGTVKVADFGLAKVIGGTEDALMTGLTQTGTAMGTPHYMAPEQWEHPELVDHRADIYALGVVFYEMLTGERPAGVFEPPSKKTKPPVDKKLDGVVMRAMDKNPDRRYQQAGQIGDDITRISGANKSKPATTATPEAKGGLLKPLLSLGIAAALAVGGSMLWPEEQENKKPLAAAPPAAVTPPASKSSPYPAGQWAPLIRTLDDLPEHVRSKFSLSADGRWIIPQGIQHFISMPDIHGRDWGMKAVFRRDGPHFSQLQLRLQGTQQTRENYRYCLVEKSPGVSQVAHFRKLGFADNKTSRSLSNKNAPAPLPDGEEYTLEFYAIGSRLIGRLNGNLNDKLLHHLEDDALHEGTIGLYVGEAFRDVEVINLDGLSEAEALKLAGVDSTVPPKPALGGPSVLPPFTDREAAEWVLGLGHSDCNVKVRPLKGGPVIEVRNLADLPVEHIVVVELKLNPSFKHSPELWKKITDAAVLRLAGLKSLTLVQIRGNVTGASLKVMAHHPGLEELLLDGLNLRVDDLHHLRASRLKRLAIPMLQVTDPASLAVLSTMPNLRQLQLPEFLDPALASALPKLPKLMELRANNSASTTDDVLPLLVERFPQLTLLHHWGAKNLKGSTLGSLKALKSLTTLGLVDTAVNDEALSQIAGMTQLLSLDLGLTRITDACLPTLKSFPKLEALHIFQTELTDATLLELASISTLKKLVVQSHVVSDWKPRVTFTAEGIAAFAKLRPDVVVIHPLPLTDGLPSPPSTSVPPQTELEGPSALPTPNALPAFTDREAAEWVLGLGNNDSNIIVRPLKDGPVIEVRKLEELPAEPFVIVELNLNPSFKNSPELWMKVTDASVLRLAGLEFLTLAALRGNITGASLKVMAHLPSLVELLFEGMNLRAEDLHHLQASRLERLGIPMLHVAGAESLAVLASMPYLRHLQLMESLDPAMAAALPKLPKLESLRADNSINTTDETLPLLVEKYPQLRMLQLWGAENLKGTKLGSLKDLRNLTELGLNNTEVNDEALSQIAGAPQLLSLELGHTRITDACLPTLLSFPKLESLIIFQTELTDATLRELAAISTLKRLRVKTPHYGSYKPQVTYTDAGITAFEKLRPDVQVVK